MGEAHIAAEHKVMQISAGHKGGLGHRFLLSAAAEAGEFGDKFAHCARPVAAALLGQVGRDQRAQGLGTVPVRRGGRTGQPLVPARVGGLGGEDLATHGQAQGGMRVK